MKIENLFVTWQQRSAQSNMPISVSAAQAGRQQSGPMREQWSSEWAVCRGWCLAVEQCFLLELGLLGSGAGICKWGFAAQHWKSCKAGWLPRKLDPHLSSTAMLQTACSWS